MVRVYGFILTRAIALLGAIALDSDSPHSASASQLCEELEGLRIGQGYAEAIADGVVKLRSGSWIV